LSDDDLSTIQILNAGLPKDNIKDKGFTVDLLLTIQSGDALHIEMQTGDHKNFKERVQLCNARKAGQQMKVGEMYHEIRRVRRTISLVITTFPVFKKDGTFHEKIVMRRENGEIFTKAQELNIIDLTKIDLEDSMNREKYLWAKLFQVTTMEELEMIAKETAEMAEAAEKLLQISADERAQAYAFSYENAVFARAVYEQDFQDEVIERAEKEVTERIKNKVTEQIEHEMKERLEDEINKIQEALHAETNKTREALQDERALEIAKSLLLMGLCSEDISEATGISIVEVEKLRVE